MRLLRLEIERSLRRRMVWVLVAIALAGIVVIALIVFFTSVDATMAELDRPGEAHPALMRTWWIPGSGDGVLLVCGLFLMMGGLIGGAGVVGGEWRTGSIATLLTWEPRRVRLLATRLVAMAICAFGIGFVLQSVLLLALLPAVIINGTTAGADGAFAVSLAAAMARIALITALGAVLAGCVASISRSTAGAIIGIWVWLALGETLLRARKPRSGEYLLAENIATVIEWARPRGLVNGRDPVGALTLLVLYTVLLAAVAARVFRRTDVIAN
jgi:hypothetical protein